MPIERWATYLVSAEIYRHVYVIDIDEDPRPYAVPAEGLHVGSDAMRKGGPSRAALEFKMPKYARNEVHGPPTVEFCK